MYESSSRIEGRDVARTNGRGRQGSAHSDDSPAPAGAGTPRLDADDDDLFQRPQRAGLTRSPYIWVEEVTEDTCWWIKLPVEELEAGPENGPEDGPEGGPENGGPEVGFGNQVARRRRTRLGSVEEPACYPFDALDTQLIDALEAPLETLCTCCLVIEQRAQALRAIFSSLTAAQARALHARLGAEDSHDQVTLAFGRLSSPYRARLRAFLDHHARSREFEAAGARSLRRPGSLERTPATEPMLASQRRPATTRGR